ncbi:MAG: response regulator transcription factor [Rubrobacter sp.]|nr:response regulator transcription factor [Rubrobacter sp.]
MSRVLLIEDHVSFSESLALMLDKEPDIEVVGRASSVGEAMKMVEVGADVAVMDLGLPDGSGAEVMWELREANPDVKMLVLTSSVDREQIARAVEAGAGGFLHKSARVGEIVAAIRRLSSGEVLIPPEEIIELLRLAAQKREEWHRQRLAVMKLTKRETQVLEALAEGLDSEGIARRLGVTVETERTHIVNILNKLKAHSRLEAVVIAVRHGVVEIRTPDRR